MTEQSFTEEQKRYIQQRIDQRVEAELMPRIDEAFDLGGIAVLRTLVTAFEEDVREVLTKADLILAFKQFEVEISPDGHASRLVDVLEESI